MKTIGLLGGMSWESTLTYYREINAMVKQRLGGLHSAEIVLRSLDFDPIEALMQQGDWNKTAQQLVTAALSVQAGGADCLLICTNTMHKVADTIASAIDIPLLHIADATAVQLVGADIQSVGLLGTAFTMEESFYKGRLADNFDLQVIVPEAADRKLVHDVIFEELCLGTITPSSKQTYLRIIEEMVQKGAQGVVLGCTEIGLLVDQQDTKAPLFDTTRIHAAKAVDWAIGNK